MVYLRPYALRQVSKNQFVISLPTIFVTNTKIKQGGTIHCYLNDRGDLIYRPTLCKTRGRIHYKTYTCQRSGERGVKCTVPPVFRDTNNLKRGQPFHCYKSDDEVIFRKKKP